MPSAIPHRIFRCIIEVEGVPRASAETWRHRARALWESELAPRLTSELDAHFRGDECIRLDRLEVQLRIGEEAGTAAVGREFRAALQQSLRNKPEAESKGSNRGSSTESKGRDWLELWLVTGLVPWWGGKPTATEIAEKLLAKLSAPSGPSWLRAILNRQSVVSRRLSLQFDAEWQKTALARVWAEGGSAASVAAFIPTLAGAFAAQTPSESTRAELWEGCWRLWSRTGELSPKFSEAISAAAHLRDTASLQRFHDALLAEAKSAPASGDEDDSSHATATSQDATPASPRRSEVSAKLDRQARVPDDEVVAPQTPGEKRVHEIAGAELESALTPGLPVVDAGLVLVAPYLPPFFEGLGLRWPTEPGTEAGATLAPLLLHFLATGSQEAAEHELALAKLLCGIALETPVPCRHAFSSVMLAEGDALLAAVIEHWPALKNTSPQGLRESFLQRGGLLRDTGPQWMLRVEHRAWDVLLERVPWTFGTIRLPWMERPLMVEWPAYA